MTIDNKEVPIGNRSVVVRITDVCNNQCAHCCFSCSPKNKLYMEESVAQKINSFFVNTETTRWWFNVMGGEPTLHPHYEDVINSFGQRNIRLVTNGWWIKNPKATDRFVTFLKSSRASIHIGVSRDKFHPPKVGDLAYTHLMSLNFKDDFGLSAPEPANEEKSIAMVGRAWWNGIGDEFLNRFHCYCMSSNTRSTSFTVLEDGTITHCPFGIIPIGKIESSTIEDLHIKKEKIKKAVEENLMSCYNCYKAWEMGGRSRFISAGYDIYRKSSL